MDPRSLLKKYVVRPRQKLGQNFLVSPGALEAVLAAAELTPADAVLEIGAGTGVLTAELARRADRVVAVELDDSLVRLLDAELGHLSNLQLEHGDILRLLDSGFLQERFGGQRYKVVANLPYYITSRLLRRLLEGEPSPELIVVMVQEEVAERAAASPPQMSLLAVSVQYYSYPSILSRVPAGAFVPRPEVDSAVLQLRLLDRSLFPEIPTDRFFRVVSAGFGQRRKGLANSLSSNLGIEKALVTRSLEAAGIAQLTRAQELSLEEWARVCTAIPWQ